MRLRVRSRDRRGIVAPIADGPWTCSGAIQEPLPQLTLAIVDQSATQVALAGEITRVLLDRPKVRFHGDVITAARDAERTHLSQGKHAAAVELDGDSDLAKRRTIVARLARRASESEVGYRSPGIVVGNLSSPDEGEQSAHYHEKPERSRVSHGASVRGLRNMITIRPSFGMHTSLPPDDGLSSISTTSAFSGYNLSGKAR